MRRGGRLSSRNPSKDDLGCNLCLGICLLELAHRSPEINPSSWASANCVGAHSTALPQGVLWRTGPGRSRVRWAVDSAAGRKCRASTSLNKAPETRQRLRAGARPRQSRRGSKTMSAAQTTAILRPGEGGAGIMLQKNVAPRGPRPLGWGFRDAEDNLQQSPEMDSAEQLNSTICPSRGVSLGQGKSKKTSRLDAHQGQTNERQISRPNITFTCGATTLKQPQPPESAGAAGIDLSVEATTAALPELRLEGQITSTKIQARSAPEGRLTGMFAALGRRARIAVRCYVC
jgi:hypothetical protein